MAITISGQNNNDKILASDGVLDQISGFNVVGVLTASTFETTGEITANHIDVGSSIQLGNAGIITATTLIGNVTGNVNSTSNLLLQISGSEKFRVGNGGQLGIGGANYGSSGQVLTSGGSGSAPTWSTINSDKITEGNTEAEVVDTGSDGHFKVTTEGSERLRVSADGNLTVGAAVTISPVGNINATGIITATSFVGSGANLTGISAGTSLSGSTNNTVCTVTGANAIQGEAGLTYDGSQLIVRGSDTVTSSGGTKTVALRGGDANDEKVNLSFETGAGGPIAVISGIADATGVYPNTTGSLTFNTQVAGGVFERLRIASNGKIGIGDDAPSSDLSIKSSAPGILLTDTSGTNTYGNIDYDSNTLMITSRNNTSHADISFRGYDGTNIKTYMNLTPTGNVVTYNNHLSGTSGHQLTGWYGDDANHYTLEYKDFNEIRAVKTDNNSGYNSIVYKREMMTEYCDIEFTLKGTSSNSQRHLGFMINADGSDTSSNFDRLVFRTNTGSPSSNQIRLDKGAGGYGFNETSSNVPSFFDGNERHIHIQIRKRTFSITVNRMGQSEYNFNARNSADLVSPRGYFGFSIYEPSSASPEVTIRDFKITNYTQNAIPSTSVAFQATHSGNPGKSSGTVVKPCNVEQFDNGYGGNFNTSNYRFTAPVAGMYQFGNTFNCYSSPSDMWCGFRVNGSTLYVGNKRNNNTGSGDQNVDAYAIIQLQPGDYVEAVDNTSNGVTYSSGITWNRFEGSLIAAFK